MSQVCTFLFIPMRVTVYVCCVVFVCMCPCCIDVLIIGNPVLFFFFFFFFFFFLKPYPQTVSLSLFPTFCTAIILYHNIIMRLHEAKKKKKKNLLFLRL